LGRVTSDPLSESGSKPAIESDMGLRLDCFGEATSDAS
jgi:hypothetical protein